MVLILGASTDDTKALKNVDDVVDASSLHAKLFRALIKVEHPIAFDTVVVQETSAKLPEAFLLPIVDCAEVALRLLSEGK
jgi:hypothetical protein